jgi:hypothetical protein
VLRLGLSFLLAGLLGLVVAVGGGVGRWCGAVVWGGGVGRGCRERKDELRVGNRSPFAIGERKKCTGRPSARPFEERRAVYSQARQSSRERETADYKVRGTAEERLPIKPRHLEASLAFWIDLRESHPGGKSRRTDGHCDASHVSRRAPGKSEHLDSNDGER